MARTARFDLIFGARDNTRGPLRSANRGLRQLGQNAQGVGRLLTGALAITGIGVGVRGIQQLSDQYVILSNRVRLFTNSQQEASQVQNELFNLSNRTRASVEATAQVYQRLAQANQTLGLSQREILTVTENINQAVRVSGVEAASATQALIQLGQGIASGQLRGQELNSVLEQTPRVAQQIADTLGIGIGQIRQAAIEGRVTSDVIIEAFTNAGKLNEEFDRLGITFGEAFVVIRNEALRAIGSVQELGGNVSGLATFVRDVGTTFVRFLGSAAINILVELKVQTADWVNLLGLVPEGLARINALLPQLDGGGTVFERILSFFRDLPANVEFAASVLGVQFGRSIQLLKAEFDELAAVARFTFDIISNPTSIVGATRELKQELIDINEQRTQANVIADEAIDAAGLQLDFSRRANAEERLRLNNLKEQQQILRDTNADSLLDTVGTLGTEITPTINKDALAKETREAAAFVKANFEEILATGDTSILGDNALNIEAFESQLQDRLNASKRFTTSEIEQERTKQQGILNELQLGLEQRLITEEEFNQRRAQVLENFIGNLEGIQLPDTSDISASGGAASIFNLIPGLAGGDQADKLQEELNVLQEAFDARLELIRGFSEQLSQLGVDSATLEVELEAQRQRELSRIEQRGISERARQRTQDINNKLSAARDFARAIITITGTQNETLFRIQQAASIAIAIINTARAVTEALPNFPLAAAVAAAGAAEIATIASASIGGGGSRGSTSIGGSGSIGETQDTDGVIDTNPVQAGQEVNIVLEGSGFSRDDIRDLLEEINEATGDGTTIRSTFT